MKQRGFELVTLLLDITPHAFRLTGSPFTVLPIPPQDTRKLFRKCFHHACAGRPTECTIQRSRASNTSTSLLRSRKAFNDFASIDQLGNAPVGPPGGCAPLRRPSTTGAQLRSPVRLLGRSVPARLIPAKELIPERTRE
jgi:hypothetical protein